ncbi:MAG: DUF4238 domain-containing protein [Gammaproteobacteria bacterium]|nr:DUF4238 domain-containing protein [Rhodocyclaceae bacterium]MBU3910874.1 DUF4238 domain-containing protein [Gammaproteobacteria bacterium]MBU4006328.1 DUF4238 domain-containing protein [Gammaproteobacteria bacterium]MBU4097935.1 DUF4238 domain-containing protein [Gammaproteobacteria bacterium]MBU4148641.1 DUF4238 domain-containing protein [Gammaproteobacteria bacterium]
MADSTKRDPTGSEGSAISKSDPQITRQNHYVPIWYQKGFIVAPSKSLQLLDLDPPRIDLPNGHSKQLQNVRLNRVPANCFVAEDLYTTRFGNVINDEVERYLFGTIDRLGAIAVRAFASGDMAGIHESFQQFFSYLDAQKVRTPKGLDWIKSKYPLLTQLDLMIEMQALRQMHCTMWVESVREIVSAEESNIKFIVTDHPVTIYNPAYPPGSSECIYPEDPSTELKGSQTVFPLDANHCLILTNFEYAKEPGNVDVRSPRTHARYGGYPTLTRTDAFIRTRKLTNQEVTGINRILKARARKYVAASDKAWLEPDKVSVEPWEHLGKILLPPSNELWHFGGEIYVGYKDGSTHYQDPFGRTTNSHKYLSKKRRPGPPDRNAPCGCGSGQRYRTCCEKIPLVERPSWEVYGIRERNLMFCRAVQDILGFDSGKNWEDIRRELSDDKVKRIHETYESLWPRDTDLVALLPRPAAGTFRGLYLGIVDPRTINLNVTGWLSYFDQIVIPNPFINAGNVKPNYSPTHKPAQYKNQTIKNVYLLMMLEPYIDAGLVHLLPDPADFGGLMHLVMDMAEERVGKVEIDDKDMERFRYLQKDELKRATLGMPSDALRGLIQRTSPEMSTEELEQIMLYMKEQNKLDPLALLQELPPGEEGAQLQTIKGFNLEVSLFLAKLMGATIYTDTRVHWQHLHAHTSARHGTTPPEWIPLVEKVRSAHFMLSGNPVTDFEHRLTGHFGGMRATWRKIAASIGAKSGKPVPKRIIKELVKEFDTAEHRMCREWKAIASTDASYPPVQGRVELSIPEQGFERATVQRLLLTYGRTKRVVKTSMAMFIELAAAGQ